MVQDYNWTGWELDKNQYGKDFDLDARKRMVEGSRELLPLISQYKDKLGANILEVGSFFDPLISEKEFQNKNIYILENDKFASEFIKNTYPKSNLLISDIEELGKLPDLCFDSVVVSQVFNYINYKKFLSDIKNYMHTGSLLFINNVVDYGIPVLFSNDRPLNINETTASIEEAGYKLIESKIIKSKYPQAQLNDRLILVAEVCT